MRPQAIPYSLSADRSPPPFRPAVKYLAGVTSYDDWKNAASDRSFVLGADLTNTGLQEETGTIYEVQLELCGKTMGKQLCC